MTLDLFSYVILLPVAGFLVNGLLGLFNLAGWRSEARKPVVGWLASAAILVPFLILLQIFIGMAAQDKGFVTLYNWLTIETLQVNISYQVDSLSVLMGLMVTGIGFLIHVYSIGYMKHDPGFWRFFVYLNLFIFSMLNLIFADNLMLLFLGWEGVGLCSYLLIGFWYQHAFANDAAIKAFVMNRIGDFAFLIGMFLLFTSAGSLNFDAINQSVGALDPTTLFLAGLFLFIGATGKSAQIPLYTWLPDAMAGPTPVSALIHAATMVTAGVYMVARLSPLFSASPELMVVIAVIGGLTAFLAATIGLFQNDIKKVLAYSTVSQLGYMFLAAGVGAFPVAIFHVFTHAFFKACLFLGSGSVIHAMHEEQDIRNMGGLRKYLPQTYLTFFIATLALAGFPLTAGFFSKDEILFRTFASGNYLLWGLALFSALLTAVYMMRLTSLTFYGRERFDAGHKHPHESPALMTLPLWVLAAGALTVGFLGLPGVVSHSNWITEWLSPAVITAEVHATHTTEWILIGLGSVIALTGLFAGWKLYTTGLETVTRLKSGLSGLYNLVYNKYFVDELYDRLVVGPYTRLSESVLAKIENRFFYPVFGWTSSAVSGFADTLRYIQTGYTPVYLTLFIIGVIGLISLILFI
ncbi:MAG: NADH-quinone oxidoreductase subunit L [Bacteroidetes bacterium]|nr:NADH-quinone oxidoreductase subunit L [Bacteroidota bacterium]